MKAFKAKIYGIVQGVGFRYATLREARRLGVAGYVRNLFDGSVEVLAEGSFETLARFRAWLNRGPPGAVVENVEVRELTDLSHFTDFKILD